MAVVPQDIKDFFALAGFTVTNQHLLKIQQALATQRYGRDADGNPITPTSADFVDWLYRQAKHFVNTKTEHSTKGAVIIPPGDLL